MSIAAHLAELERRHRALEAEIVEARAHPSIDHLPRPLLEYTEPVADIAEPTRPISGGLISYGTDVAERGSRPPAAGEAQLKQFMKYG